MRAAVALDEADLSREDPVHGAYHQGVRVLAEVLLHALLERATRVGDELGLVAACSDNYQRVTRSAVVFLYIIHHLPGS